MKESVLAATVFCVATASAGIFGGDSSTTTTSGAGGQGGSSKSGKGGNGTGGSATGGNGGQAGQGGSNGGFGNVETGAGYGATNNAPILVGPSQSVVNGVPAVTPGKIMFGNSVNLGGGTAGSNSIENNGNVAGNGGSSNGNNKSGSGKGAKSGKSKGAKGGNTGNGGGNTSKGGDSSLSFSPTIPIPRDLSALGRYLNQRRQLQFLRRRDFVDKIRRIADPELFYNEVYARDAEADAEPEFDQEDIYARDPEPEADYDHIYARYAEPEYESYFDEVYARDLPMGRYMMMSS